AGRNAPTRDLRRSWAFATAVHDRRFRPGGRRLGGLAGWAGRSVSVGRRSCWPGGRLRPHGRAARCLAPGKEWAAVTEASNEGRGAGQDGQDEEAEAEKEDRTRQVATALVDPRAGGGDSDPGSPNPL